jgi:GNAT superfamily N-acetyltransferase
VLRDEGLKSLWFKILGETVYRRLLLVERILEGGETDDDERTGRLSLLTMADLPRYAAFRPETDLEVVRQRLDRGECCFVMSIGDEIAHACWIVSKQPRIEYLRCEVDLASDVCLAYDVYTKPGFRGRGIAGARTRQMEPFLVRAGYRYLLSAIGAENYRSLYFNTAAGHEVVGVIGYYQFGPWRHYFCKVRAGSESTALLEPRRV